MNKNFTELPLSLKLGAYRRNLLLSGLDKKDSDIKLKGQAITKAMKLYKDEIDPDAFKRIDF